MVMSVAPVTDQLKVDDWPRSIVEGSAVKLLIVGFEILEGGGADVVFDGGGGGGGGGVFFLQPGANAINVSANSNALNLEGYNL